LDLGGDTAFWFAKPRKPLRFIDARNGRFARKEKAINTEVPPSNAGLTSRFSCLKQFLGLTAAVLSFLTIGLKGYTSSRVNVRNGSYIFSLMRRGPDQHVL
jgi:hypothetical protein